MITKNSTVQELLDAILVEAKKLEIESREKNEYWLQEEIEGFLSW